MAEGSGGLPVKLVAQATIGPAPMPIRFVTGAMPVQFVDGVSGPSGIPVYITDGVGVGPSGLAVSLAFDPAILSPTVWLKGGGTFWQDSARTTPATADGDPVGAWDNSGSGAHAVQATAGLRFLLRTGVNGLNGISVARSDGTDDRLRVSALATAAAQTVFVVMKKNSAAGATYRTPISLAGAGAAQLFTNTGDGAGFIYYGNNAGTFVVLGGTPTAWNIVSFTYASAASTTIRIGGGAGSTFDPHNDYSTATILDLGDANGTNRGDYDFAEVIRVDSALSLVNHNNIGNYLATKYGLTWTAAA